MEGIETSNEGKERKPWWEYGIKRWYYTTNLFGIIKRERKEETPIRILLR